MQYTFVMCLYVIVCGVNGNIYVSIAELFRIQQWMILKMRSHNTAGWQTGDGQGLHSVQKM